MTEYLPIRDPSKILPGTFVTSDAYGFPYGGIAVGNATVICQSTPNTYDVNFCEIKAIGANEFRNGGTLYEIAVDTEYSPQDAVLRAVSAIGRHIGVHSHCADDFLMWCLTGHEIVPDSLIWGEHLEIPFEAAGGFVTANHHGIGIDSGMVVHFKTEQETERHQKTVLWNKHIKMETFDEFNLNGLAKKVPYSDKYNTVQARREARTRAINCLVCRERLDYKILTRNCEHLAEYCKTGSWASGQAKRLVATAAAVAISGIFAAGGSQTASIMLAKSIQEGILKKFIKAPWTRLS